MVVLDSTDFNGDIQIENLPEKPLEGSKNNQTKYHYFSSYLMLLNGGILKWILDEIKDTFFFFKKMLLKIP